MNRFGRVTTACLIAGAAAAVSLPVGSAHADDVVTKISLAEFRTAYRLASVRRILSDNSSGLAVWLTKRDANGNRIDWTDPNRAVVDQSKSFIWFRVNPASFDDLVEALMEVGVQFTQVGGPSIRATISCDLEGSSTGGVTSVDCGGGRTVSPS